MAGSQARHPIKPFNAARLFMRVAGLALVTLASCGRLQTVLAQDAARQPATDKGKTPATIQLTLPPETELKTLIDLVSQRLGVPILCDESVANKRISLNSP